MKRNHDPEDECKNQGRLNSNHTFGFPDHATPTIVASINPNRGRHTTVQTGTCAHIMAEVMF